MLKNIFKKKKEVVQSNITNANIILSPFNGQRVELSTIDDFVFSKGLMGKGIAIVPTEETVYSPVDGTIVVIVHTKHAIGIKTDNGIEVLIHIGYKTELLKGEEFTIYHTVGQRVAVGEKIMTFKSDEMHKKGIDLTTIIVVTNTNDFNNVVPINSLNIKKGDQIIEVVQ
jgi:glucose-specific phosphotransferase system IIA component